MRHSSLCSVQCYRMSDNSTRSMCCPLLAHPNTYNPDTIDLINNNTARLYWLDCLDSMAKKYVGRAALLNPGRLDATEKAELCYQQFHILVQAAYNEPKTNFYPLSVRTLLDRYQCILSEHFEDPWRLQKQMETKVALHQLSDRLVEIDAIQDTNLKLMEIVQGALAGNFFDWGSAGVARILERPGNFGLHQAMATIQQRPWFRDDLDAWIQRIQFKPYRHVVIFVDNAGMDFILGILPLVRHLLTNSSTKVVLTANSSPVLNDITIKELHNCILSATELCAILRKAHNEGRLEMVENGQTGPCLDFAHISPELHGLMLHTDLIMIEGMGRAVHTNLNVPFIVDCVKMAVLKNEWLANNLGANQFSVIFQYEPAIMSPAL